MIKIREQVYDVSTLLNPSLYREKSGLQGYTLFLFFSTNIDHSGGSNIHLQSMFRPEIRKILQIFVSKMLFIEP